MASERQLSKKKTTQQTISISLSDLEDAQIHPEKYRDFMVRVSGYSARFVDLPKAVQDDIMARYCYGNL